MMSDNNQPLVSIVVPVYNREKTITKCIDSLLSQSYTSFEIVVVDDCSSDNTLKLLFGYTDKRIRIICHSENKGAAEARNTGINNSVGELIAFQDSDDEWIIDKLKVQIKALTNNSNNAKIVYSKFKRELPDKSFETIPQSTMPLSGNILPTLLYGNVIGPPTVILYKEAIEHAKFDTSLKALEDWDFFLQLARRHNFLYIDEVLVYSFISPGSISSNKINEAKALKDIIVKNKADFAKNMSLYNRWMYESAFKQIAFGDSSDARAFLKANIDSKLSLKFFFLLGLSFFNIKIRQSIYKKLKNVS